MTGTTRPFAVVTGASSGIGYELAACCMRDGFDLVIAANEPRIHEAAKELQAKGGSIEAVEADLATPEGCVALYKSLNGRPVDALLANAGVGLGKAFLDQEIEAWGNVIDTNINGTLYLIQKVGRDMRARGQGRILITGSIAGFMPGTFQAVYNGSKAFLDSFSFALRHELQGSGVTVTCLMPGATETEFFERADMLDTKIGASKKDDPAFVAQQGFDAMKKGEGQVIAGWMNKMQAAIAHLAPSDMTAEAHRKMAEPGTGKGKSAA
jgi:short-subunit dehydrogenase